MTERFNNWIKFIFKWEGTVYENDPDDPGGETKYGIDKRSHQNEDIKNLTEERAKEIYYEEYWTAIKAESFEYPVGEVLGNIAVNCGKGRASRWLQEAVGTLVDGSIGPKTIKAANALKNDALANMLLERTETHYRSIAKNSKLKKFLNGWLNRNNDFKKYFKV